jgi:flagellar motility protein MotE (MotC chaperone)
MQLSFQKVQTGTETKVSTPYDAASHLAYSKGFKTLKEYSEYVVSNKLTGFLPDPTKYAQYTTAWNFLGTSRTQYYANRAQILMSKRDQEAVNRKTRETRARNKAEREAKLEQTVSITKLIRPINTFTVEEVIDILVKSNADTKFIAEFINTHNVNDAYAVKVLVNLLKSKTQVAVIQ